MLLGLLFVYFIIESTVGQSMTKTVKGKLSHLSIKMSKVEQTSFTHCPFKSVPVSLSCPADLNLSLFVLYGGLSNS